MRLLVPTLRSLPTPHVGTREAEKPRKIISRTTLMGVKPRALLTWAISRAKRPKQLIHLHITIIIILTIIITITTTLLKKPPQPVPVPLILYASHRTPPHLNRLLHLTTTITIMPCMLTLRTITTTPRRLCPHLGSRKSPSPIRHSCPASHTAHVNISAVSSMLQNWVYHQETRQRWTPSSISEAA